MKSELEQKLEDTYISITERILYFPCRTNQPSTIYKDFYWFNFRKPRVEEQFNTLYIAVKDKSYMEIVENIYKAFTGENLKTLYHLTKEERKLIYNKVTKNPMYEHIKRL